MRVQERGERGEERREERMERRGEGHDHLQLLHVDLVGPRRARLARCRHVRLEVACGARGMRHDHLTGVVKLEEGGVEAPGWILTSAHSPPSSSR